MTIKADEAIVFHGGNRRWFTLNAACRAEAKAMLTTRCECARGDYDGQYGTPSETCFYHDPANYPRLVRRLARLHKIAYLGEKP